MTVTNSGVHPMEDPEGQLELALIEEFLLTHGYVPRDLDRLPSTGRGADERSERGIRIRPAGTAG